MNGDPKLRILEFSGFYDRIMMAAPGDSCNGCRAREAVDRRREGRSRPGGGGDAFGGAVNHHVNGSAVYNGFSKGKGQLDEGQRRRKLVLHFDIRNTILVADSVTKVNMEQALNTFLTGVTWGRNERDEWVWLSDVPSIGPPCAGAITYYKYLEGKLARSPDDRGHLRRATGDFTQKDVGRKFRPYFEKHLKLLEWNEDIAPNELLTMVGPENRRYHYLLPSFIRLINRLYTDGRDFAIVLRTYGMDASNVLSSIQHIVAGNHPQFPQGLPIRVSRTPGQIRRFEGGRIQLRCGEDGAAPTEIKEQNNPEVYEDELEFLKMLNACNGILGFVDDFVHWQRNNYSHLAGKPLWIDPNDDWIHHIFFDDNIRISAEDSIVDVRLLRSDRRGFDSITDAEEMAKLEDACLVQADLLQIISDLDYFLEKVKLCEERYDELLSRSSFH